MAYHGKGKFEKNSEYGETPKKTAGIYFEEKKCRFGAKRFSVMLPRKTFADLILNYPAAGVA